MVLYLLFQIVVSWLITCCILKIFNKLLVTSDNEFYQEPVLLTSLFSAVDIDLTSKEKLRAGMLLHHVFGLFFAAVYYMICYYEFAEISWSMSFIIGIISGFVRIISWTFLLEIIPATHLSSFKGYYLQLVFVHNIFTISALTLYNVFS
jgi:hypothetical protein